MEPVGRRDLERAPALSPLASHLSAPRVPCCCYRGSARDLACAINMVDRLRLESSSVHRHAHGKEHFYKMQNRLVANYAYEHGIDSPEITGWKCPF